MGYTVAAVERAIELLFLVAQQSGLGVTELARRSGNTKARTFRLLETLEHSGLLQRIGESATYGLGYKAMFLGIAAQGQLSLIRVAKKSLDSIGANWNENASVRVRDGLESICIARWDARHAVAVHGDVGSRRPLHVGASGKLLLAFAPKEIRDAVLASNMTRVTANTIVDPGALEKELLKIRQQGYSASLGEGDPDAAAIAAPVHDASGQVVASLSTAGPSSHITPKKMPAFIDLVRAGARKLSTELGYTGQYSDD